MELKLPLVLVRVRLEDREECCIRDNIHVRGQDRHRQLLGLRQCNIPEGPC